MFDSLWITLLVVGYLLTWGLIPWVLLKKKVHPTASVAWMLAIIFLPYLGGLLCLFFGLNRVERHKAGRRAASHHITERSPAEQDGSSPNGARFVRQQHQLVRLLDGLSDMPLTFGNQVELLPAKQRAFELMGETICNAQQSLHIEFYIWQADETGVRIRDLLIERARDGVEVRFIYDGLGSMNLGQKFLRPMQEVGIRVVPFLPGRSLRERWSINLRNHRKLIIADGVEAYTGGLNVGDEYLSKKGKYGDLRDTQLRVRGPAVRQLQQVFVEDWYYATGEELTDRRYFPDTDRDGPIAAQVVADGPDTQPDVFHALIFSAITEAEKSVTLSSPYFIPPESIVMALEAAARRGVRVRMMVAGDSTFRWTLLAGRSYYDALLAAGVEIYEYQIGLYHPKVVTIDGNWSLVGTMNLDSRSLLLNFEVGLVLYDAELAEQLEQHFEEDLKHADQIDPKQWSQRSTWSRLGENFWRLFEPIL